MLNNVSTSGVAPSKKRKLTKASEELSNFIVDVLDEANSNEIVCIYYISTLRHRHHHISD